MRWRDRGTEGAGVFAASELNPAGGSRRVCRSALFVSWTIVVVPVHACIPWSAGRVFTYKQVSTIADTVLISRDAFTCHTPRNTRTIPGQHVWCKWNKPKLVDSTRK